MKNGLINKLLRIKNMQQKIDFNNYNFKILVNKTFHKKGRRSTFHLKEKILKNIKKSGALDYMEDDLEFTKIFEIIDKRIQKNIRRIDGKEDVED